MRNFLTIIVCLFFFSPTVQGDNVTPQRRRSRGPTATEPHWISPTRLWIRSVSGNETQFWLIDAEQKKIAPAFDAQLVAKQLSELLKQSVSPQSLRIDDLEFSNNEVVLTGYGSKWRLSNKKLVKVNPADSVSGTIPVSLTIRESRRSGTDTSIVFENRLATDVVIAWNDADGNQHKYGTLAPGKLREQHTYAGDVWVITKNDGKLVGVYAGENRPGRAIIDGRPADPPRQSRQPQQSRNKRRSPASNTQTRDSKWTAFCRDNNLWLRDRKTDAERPLTHDGNEKLTWHRSVLRARGIHMRYTQPEAPAEDCEAYWSPDGQYVVAIRTHVVPLPEVNIVQAAGPNGKPKLISYPYFKPGDELPLQEPRMFHAESGREIVISNELFPNPFELSNFRWRRDSSQFTFRYNERGHQVLRHLAVDATSGNVTAVCDEHSETFIDYAGKFFLRELQQSDETIWMSERDGWNHLYLFDSNTGALKNQITSGKWVVRGVDRIDEANKQIHFRAGGIHPEQDPYHVHFCRINFDGSDLTTLTQADGTHEITMGPGGQFFFDRYSRVDLPHQYQIRSANDGSLSVDIPTSQPRITKTQTSQQQSDRPLPERFVAKGRDGTTDIYGIIHRPQNFDPTKRYPVVENIYAGPHSAHVPKAFRTSYRHQHQIADLGCIVVQIDGMGTSLRSKAFHDVCWKNIADAGFLDRIAWIKAAAEKFPFMDTSNVGIYGGSAGGQNALGALLHHGDFYKAAVADCGCHDNRMDKIWWNELWMGWPIESHYDEQSNVTNARKLNGKLLLVVGEMDKNVDPASTMQVVNALIKANKDFEFLIVPGGGHGIAESPYGSRRRAEFFKRHLIDR